MRIVYSTEKGFYLDAKAAHVFFAEGNTFIPAGDYKLLFSKIDADPNLFGVVPIYDSYKGENLEVLHYLWSGDYKVFGEVFISPLFHIVSKNESSLQNIERVYFEPWATVLCENCYAGLLQNKKTITCNDINSILESDEHEKDAFLVTESIIRQNKALNVIKKNVGGQKNTVIRYLIVGKSFFDMPSDKSDKAIVLFHATNNMNKAFFEELLTKNKMTIFKLIFRPSPSKPAESEYYLEVGFRGLLDLEELENNSTYFQILGIFESGKVFTI